MSNVIDLATERDRRARQQRWLDFQMRSIGGSEDMLWEVFLELETKRQNANSPPPQR